ncbi:PIF1 [Symbiodinium sp. CCMP2592]|nr:PIF1 [Symbiodinium sp. CCMP2592]
MGRRGIAKGGSKGAGKAGEQPKESQYVKRVDLYKFLGKWMLRSYPDERGRPLMLGAKKSTAQAALEPEALRAILDADCCELLRRPTMGLNLAAASIDCAALLGPVLQEKMDSLLPKVTSATFLDKVQFLNLARNVDRNPEDVPEQCKSLLKKVKHLVRDHGEDLAAAAEAAAGVFLGLMSILEVAAVSKDMRAWAKGVPERRKQSKHLQAWLQDPDDEDKFLAAVAKAVKEDNKNTTRARRFGEFEMQAEDTSSSLTLLSSQDDSPSSSVLRASKKKRGKGKKQTKAKTSKKAKKSKQRKEASSSQDAASQPSSRETEPAPKKRRPSARASGSKVKKARVGISVESESADSEQLQGQLAGKDLCKTWSLSELQAFEEMAAQQVTAADNAVLEAEQRLAVSKALPAELRRMVWERAGLLPSTENEEVLKANAERLVKHTFQMVKEVRLAWVQAAVQLWQPEVMYAMHGFALVIVDEFSQLSQEQFERILHMWGAADNFPALIFAGDKYQLPGIEPTRPWDSPAWKPDTLYFLELTEVWRTTDKSFLEMLDLLRTCMPTSRELQKICRGHKAWVGQDPSVADVKRLLRDHPRAVWVAATKRGVAQINQLALEALHPRAEPVVTLPGAFEDNPDNYKKDGTLVDDQHLVTTDVPIHQGLKLYLTRNVRKADDYVNGMQCKVLSFDMERKILWVRTETGKRLPITPWHDPDHSKLVYYPIRLGFCTTVHKVQGDEFDFIIVYLDTAGMPAVGYTALSRVRNARSYLLGGMLTREHFTPVTLR